MWLHRNWRRIFGDVVFYALVFSVNNIVSYLFIVIAGREFSAPEFGVFSALLGLITMAGIFSTSFQVATTQAVSLHADQAVLRGLIRHISRVTLPVISGLTLLMLPLGPRIGASAAQIAVCGIIVFVMFLAAASLGFLGGLRRIRAQAGLNLAGAAIRLATGWPLIVIGYGVGGALVGYLVNYAVIFGVAYAMTLRLVRSAGLADASVQTEAAKAPRLHSRTIATFVLTVAPYCLDQTMVQVFNPALGGDYAALAAIAKLVFLATYPIVAVIYPHVINLSDTRSRLQLFAVTAGAMICAVTLLAALLYSYPDQAVHLFFGASFQHVAPYLGFLAFGVACLSISVLAAHALIAWASPIGFLPSLIALGLGITFYAVRHNSLAEIVSDQIWMYGIQLVLILVLCATTLRRSSATTDMDNRRLRVQGS